MCTLIAIIIIIIYIYKMLLVFKNFLVSYKSLEIYDRISPPSPSSSSSSSSSFLSLSFSLTDKETGSKEK